jgi:hypothetical protein
LAVRRRVLVIGGGGVRGARLKSAAMEIGEPERTVTVEPLEDPVPREAPAEPEPEREPAEVPREPERLPA